MDERNVRDTLCECVVDIGAVPLSVGLYTYKGGVKQSWHQHPESVVAFVVGGALREGVRNRDEAVSTFHLGTKESGRRHTEQFGPHGAVVLRLAFDPRTVPLLEPIIPRISVWNWRIGDAPMVQSWLRLALMLREAGVSTDLENAVSEALATLQPTARNRRPQDAPRWLRDVCERLLDEPHTGMRLAAAARHAGVHPIYLARQFRRFYGCSVDDFRRACRVREAAAMLTTESRSIASTAHTAGFTDQAHLSRVFRESTGMTPSRYRALAVQPSNGRARSEAGFSRSRHEVNAT